MRKENQSKLIMVRRCARLKSVRALEQGKHLEEETRAMEEGSSTNEPSTRLSLS